MQIVIDISKLEYEVLQEHYKNRMYDIIKEGTPLEILADGTLTIPVDDATKVRRVFVQDNKNNGGLFYADSN